MVKHMNIIGNHTLLLHKRDYSADDATAGEATIWEEEANSRDNELLGNEQC